MRFLRFGFHKETPEKKGCKRALLKKYCAAQEDAFELLLAHEDRVSPPSCICAPWIADEMLRADFPPPWQLIFRDGSTFWGGVSCGELRQVGRCKRSACTGKIAYPHPQQSEKNNFSEPCLHQER